MASVVVALFKRLVGRSVYVASRLLLWPFDKLLCIAFRNRGYQPKSVLHVSYMVHIPWQATRELRKLGWQADYLAIGSSPHWDQCDIKAPNAHVLVRAFVEWWFFWMVVARYQVVHLHFMLTPSQDAWELKLLRSMGRVVVAHFRGCEARDRVRNMALHPDMNICQQCDYNATVCSSPNSVRRRALASRWATATLVTTPDMLDFMPNAQVSSFFVPDVVEVPLKRGLYGAWPLRLVHATNHPGIEGTEDIKAAVQRLQARGYAIEFEQLGNVSNADVMHAMREADLAIGKMKMGYYANSQIESMALGVPTITWVRPEFMTPELEASGFIICHLRDLEATLEHYLKHPKALEEKRQRARSSIRQLHNNHEVALRMVHAYAAKEAS
jgi:hypothetical protein